MAEPDPCEIRHDPSAASTKEVLAALCNKITELMSTAAGPVASVSARAGDCEVQISWDHHDLIGAAALPPAIDGTTTPAAGSTETGADEAGYHCVTAPIVGTFYRAPQPGAAPFVDVGQRVEVGQTLAIVEAMKLMNPVKSELSGTVREVLVANGRSVEFGQPLMFIDRCAE